MALILGAAAEESSTDDTQRSREQEQRKTFFRRGFLVLAVFVELSHHLAVAEHAAVEHREPDAQKWSDVGQPALADRKMVYF